MNKFEQYRDLYRDNLLNDIIPFWIKHSVDRECGGFMFAVNRDRTVIDTDKGVWQTSRQKAASARDKRTGFRSTWSFLPQGQAGARRPLREARKAMSRGFPCHQRARGHRKLRFREEMEDDLRMAAQLQKTFFPTSYPHFPAGADPETGTNQEEFGEERLLSAAQQHMSLDLPSLFPAILNEARWFSADKAFEDDVCLAGFHLHGLAEA